jgi:type III restriction enzyme
MARIAKDLKATADRPWQDDALDAPGTGRMAVMYLEQEREEQTSIDVIRSARTQNGVFLRRRILQRNRACLNAIHPDWFRGAAFEQLSCHGSQAQEDLVTLAAKIVEFFEDRVGYEDDPDPERAIWVAGEHRPRGPELLDFQHAAHEHYAAKDFNKDELAFAQALDRRDDIVWARNPATANLGYGVPLPKKVGDSSTFYPDFLVWHGEDCWAVDTTGRHLLDEKVRGTLISLGQPRMALVVRGEVDLESGAREGNAGWSSVVGRPSLRPLVEHTDDLNALVDLLLAR